MTETVKKFIDCKCQIYLLSGEVCGVIREVTDHAMLVETPTDRQAINLDFVVRIREYPQKKKTSLWHG